MEQLFELLKAHLTPEVSDQKVNKKQVREQKQRKNAKGSQSIKLVEFLTAHHKYEISHVGNYHPAESAEIATGADVPPATVSDFLKKHFRSSGDPRDGYINACTKNKEELLHWFIVQHKDSLPVRTDDLGNYDGDDIKEKW